MKFSLFAAALLIAAVTATQSVAAVITTGSYSYSFAGQSSDISCTDNLRDTFTGTVSVDGEPINNANFSFSACDDANVVSGGEFTLTDGGSSVSGTLEGAPAGTVQIGFETYTVTEGEFTVTSATGMFIGATGDEFIAESAPMVIAADAKASAQAVGGSDTGLFLIGTPEPGTTALGALGLFALGVLKRRTRRTA